MNNRAAQINLSLSIIFIIIYQLFIHIKSMSFVNNLFKTEMNSQSVSQYCLKKLEKLQSPSRLENNQY